MNEQKAIKLCERIFGNVNSRFFYSGLPLPKFAPFPLPHAVGACTKSGAIFIDELLFKVKNFRTLIKPTIIHECIHHAINIEDNFYNIKNHAPHGDRFREYCNFITNIMGYPEVSRAYDGRYPCHVFPHNVISCVNKNYNKIYNEYSEYRHKVYKSDKTQVIDNKSKSDIELLANRHFNNLKAGYLKNDFSDFLKELKNGYGIDININQVNEVM